MRNEYPASLTLLLPYLIQAAPEAPEPLERLLSRADSRPVELSPEHLAVRAFGIAAEPPEAALVHMGRGGEAGPGRRFRAAAVHILADRDKLYLLDCIDDLTPGEAQQIETLVNEHFQEDGIALSLDGASAGLLEVPEAMAAARPTSLHEAHGFDLHLCLPQGEGRLAWLRFLNELQMLMHAAPFNQKRREEGRTEVNSLWFWGAGELPAAPAARPFDWIAGEEPFARGLARWAGVEYISACEPEAVLARAGRGLLISRGPETAALWAAAGAAVTGAVRRGTRLRLFPGDDREFRIDWLRLLRFWRRNRPLEAWR